MKYEDLQTKSKDELAKTLLALKKEQMELRFKHSGGQLDKTHELRANRRAVAQVKTLLNVGAEEKKTAKKETAAKTKAAPKKKTTTKKTEEKAA